MMRAMVVEEQIGFIRKILNYLFGVLLFLFRRNYESFGYFIQKISFFKNRKRYEKVATAVKNFYELPMQSKFSQTFVKQVVNFHFIHRLDCLCIKLIGCKLEIENEEEFKEAFVKQKSGVVFIASHHGNLDLLWDYLSCQKLSIHHSYDIKDLVKLLGKGESLGFVSDKRYFISSKVNTVKVSFMKKSREFSTQSIEVALLADVPIFTASLVRVGPLKYRILFKEIFCHGRESGEVAQEIAAEYEKYVTLYPEQWVGLDEENSPSEWV